MRLVKSTEASVSRVAGSSPFAPVFLLETVGSDSSSATNGSSVARVAGKKRLPAKPCAQTGPVAAKLAQATISAQRAPLEVGAQRTAFVARHAVLEGGWVEGEPSRQSLRDGNAEHDDNRVMARPPFSKTSGRAGGATPRAAAGKARKHPALAVDRSGLRLERLQAPRGGGARTGGRKATKPVRWGSMRAQGWIASPDGNGTLEAFV